MFFTSPRSKQLKQLPAAVQPHIETIRNFVTLFPDNTMQKEVNDFVTELLTNKEESELPLVLQLAPGRSLQIFQELCRAIEAIGRYYREV